MPVYARVVFDNRVVIRQKVRAALDAGLQSVAAVTEAQAKALVPIRTGFLYSTIAAEPTGDLRYSVAALAGYSKHVELGTTQQSAQPYLVPAILFAASVLPSLFRREFGARFSR